MLARCSYLSDHQTWPIATALLSRTYRTRPSTVHQPLSAKIETRNRRSAIIAACPEERCIDRQARIAFTDALYDLLNQRKAMHGLTNREDTYISVRELLNYQHFRMLSFPNLQKVVNEDRLHRFELLYQPLKGRDTDSWWIRVKKREEKDIRSDPIIFSDNVGVAVYGTTLEEWRSYISLKGISRRNDNHIQISRGVPVQDYFISSEPTSTQVLIHIDVKHAIELGIRFFITSRPSPFSAPPTPSSLHPSTAHSNLPSQTTHLDRQVPPPQTKSPSAATYQYKYTKILTPGNEFGFLPPECFSKVEVVRVKRKVLWALNEQAVEQKQNDKNKEDAILDSDMGSVEDVGVGEYIAIDTRPKRGYKTNHVEATEKSLDQFFVDLPVDHQTRVVHPDLKQEALAVFST